MKVSCDHTFSERCSHHVARDIPQFIRCGENKILDD
jgi:hypothetical protein